MTVPICRCPCCHSVSRMPSVASVYGEFSMSMRTKNPLRIGRLEDAPHVVHRGRAIDVESQLRQLQRDVALDARGDDGVDDPRRNRPPRPPPLRRWTRFRRGSRASGAVPCRCRSATAATASSIDSPAMNRRAKPPPGRHAVLRRQPLQGRKFVRGRGTVPSRWRRASVYQHQWVALGATAGARSTARSSEARSARARGSVRPPRR